MKENYFLIPKNEYEIALSNYNSVLNAESRIETVKGRLTRYKMYVDDVLNNINSMHIKNELLTNLVRNINNLVASTNIIISDSYGLPNKITNKYKSNQIRSYIN
ncbi:MAG: hypothetical protein Q8S84_05190 [bacterium]|nr:hypothetical protein [bacterium]